MDDVAVWIQIAVALGVGGLFAEMLRGIVQRKKMGAEYAEVISRSAVGLLKPLENRIAHLENKLASTEARLAKSEMRARVLQRDLAEAESKAEGLARHLVECNIELNRLRGGS